MCARMHMVMAARGLLAAAEGEVIICAMPLPRQFSISFHRKFVIAVASAVRNGLSSPHSVAAPPELVEGYIRDRKNRLPHTYLLLSHTLFFYFRQTLCTIANGSTGETD